MGTPKLAVLRAPLGNDHFPKTVLSWCGRFVFVRRAIITISRWGVFPLSYSYGSIDLSTGVWGACGGGGGAWLGFVLICCVGFLLLLFACLFFSDLAVTLLISGHASPASLQQEAGKSRNS